MLCLINVADYLPQETVESSFMSSHVLLHVCIYVYPSNHIALKTEIAFQDSIWPQET